MLVVIRFRVPSTDHGFVDDAQRALEILMARPGCLGGDLGRNVDDPTLWAMVTRWVDVGSYRRSLSAYDVKLHAVPLLSRAIDEPTAFETTDGELNRPGARDLG